jgi:hypothetical protein
MNRHYDSISAKVALAAAFLFITLLLNHLNVQLSMHQEFRYAAHLRIAFLFISLTFVVGAAVGLTQLRNR